jgi:hypothetical protein
MSIADIMEIEKARIERERIVFEVVYNRLKNKINNSVRARAKECIYTIPDYIPGYPLVNVSNAMAYLLEKLVNEKFIVAQLTSKDIYITWDIGKIEYSEKVLKAPIVPSGNKMSDKLAGKELERQNEDFINSLISIKKKSTNL